MRNPFVQPLLISLALGVLVVGFASRKTALSQDPDPNSTNASQNTETRDEGSQESTEMREMAQSMKSMADMCQTMMQQEMKHRPLMMIAGAVIGTLLAIGLLLFIILEIQWIRYLAVRITAEKKKLP